MFTGLLHTHRLMVTLFVLHYLIKTILILKNQGTLEKYTKKTKVFEMVISFLFLGTGIGLIVKGPGELPSVFYIKVGIVLASIPIAIIGFKKLNKALAVVSLVMLFSAYGIGEMLKDSRAELRAEMMNEKGGETVSGKDIYSINCATCHGEDGTAGISGAKDLTASTLSKEEKVEIITNGKGNMTAYGALLDKEQIEAVTEYIETLKK